MTTTDWILDIALVLLVVVQLHERRFSWHTALLPLVGVSWGVATYATSIPTAGDDLLLIAATVTAGLTLGICGGLATTVRRDNEGVTRFKASPTSAALWIAGTGARLAFIIWVTHGGGASLAHFSATHDLTVNAWTDALLLMVLAEVITRTAIIFARAARSHRHDQTLAATDAAVAMASEPVMVGTL